MASYSCDKIKSIHLEEGIILTISHIVSLTVSIIICFDLNHLIQIKANDFPYLPFSNNTHEFFLPLDFVNLLTDINFLSFVSNIECDICLC